MSADKLHRASTTTTGRTTNVWSWTGSTLPTEFLEQSCKRIGTAAVAFASLWAMAFLVNDVITHIVPMSVPDQVSRWPMPGRLVAGIGLGMSIAMIFVAGALHTRQTLLLNVGLGFEVATALLIAIMHRWEPQIIPFGVSWVCIIILAYPSIVPNTLGKTLVAALLAATMDPLMFGIAVARGAEVTAPIGGEVTV